MATQRIYRYPNKDLNKHKLWVRFKRIDFDWDGNSTTEGTSRDVTDTQGGPFGRMVANSGSEQPSVYLYLPSSINLKDGSNYDTSGLGGLGRTFEFLVNNFGMGVQANSSASRLDTLLAAGNQVISDTINTGVGIATGQSSLNPGMISLAMSRIPFANRTPIGSGVSSAIRQTANPHTRSRFESVNLRDFSFQFEFMPDNEDEARQILDIVKFFRHLAYPTTTTLSDSQLEIINNDDESGDGVGPSQEVLDSLRRVGDSLVYTFPSMVQVDMFYRLDDEARDNLENIVIENQGLEELFAQNDQDLIISDGLYRVGHRIMPCYVTSVDQTLDSQNSMVYRTIGDRRIAVPTAQTLTVNLSEDRTIDANAVELGY